jgi:hypothetical protein
VTLAQTIIVLNWLVNFGLPLLVAFITHSKAPSAVKALVNIALSLLSTAIITTVASLIAGEAIDWFQIVFAFVTGFMVSAGSYTHIWKPTGVAPVVALQGVGSHE